MSRPEVMTREAALDDLASWFEVHEIDPPDGWRDADPPTLADGERESKAAARLRVTAEVRDLLGRALQLGLLVIDGADLLYTPRRWAGAPIRLPELKAKTLVEINRHQREGDMAAIMRGLGHWTGLAPGILDRLGPRDVAVLGAALRCFSELAR